MEIASHLDPELLDHPEPAMLRESPSATARWPLALAAAAAGLVAVAALMSFWPPILLERPAPDQLADQAVGQSSNRSSSQFPGQMVRAGPAMNASYRQSAISGAVGQTRLELAIRVAEQVQRLPEETRSVVMDNLHTINKALDDIDTALREDPAADPHQRLLLSMYTEQLTMLGEMELLLHQANAGIEL
jgi:hypothetical protein